MRCRNRRPSTASLCIVVAVASNETSQELPSHLSILTFEFHHPRQVSNSTGHERIDIYDGFPASKNAAGFHAVCRTGESTLHISSLPRFLDLLRQAFGPAPANAEYAGCPVDCFRSLCYWQAALCPILRSLLSKATRLENYISHLSSEQLLTCCLASAH